MISKQAGKKQSPLCNLCRPHSQVHTAFQIYTSINAYTETIPKFFMPLTVFFTIKYPPLPLLNGKPFWTQRAQYPLFLPTHLPLTKDHNPTYFKVFPIGITPLAATLCSLHPPFSFQRPVSTKTTRLEAPKLTKSFQEFLKLLNIFSRIIITS